MKIFTDRDLTNEVKLFDFGIVDAGTTKKFTFWLYNESNAILEKLKFAIIPEDIQNELKIETAPENMKARDKSKIVFSWSPSITLKRGLKCSLSITGNEIWS